MTAHMTAFSLQFLAGKYKQLMTDKYIAATTSSDLTVHIQSLDSTTDKLTLQFQAGKVDAVQMYPDNECGELGDHGSCWLVQRTVQTSSGAVGRAPANRRQLTEDASSVL